MVESQPSIPMLLLLESASPATTSTGSCWLRPDMEMLLTYPAFTERAPQCAWLLWLYSRDHCQRGHPEECDPPTTILTVLKSDQKSVCKSWAFKTGVFCLDGWEIVCFLVWGKSSALVLCGLVSDIRASGKECCWPWPRCWGVPWSSDITQHIWGNQGISPSQHGVGKCRSCLTNLFSC